ncbi:Pre-mRNA-splicing factor of RES complex-domain-containing protein [Suillus americanus]|nr:Pre-mRNA-splicing factor of RES complex-domain-containing protein [Suillus americanus]
MQAYLAEKYMTGPKADAILSRTTQKKKKKRKADTATTASSMLMDDDAEWVGESSRRKDEEEDFAEAAVAKDRSFKKRRVEEGSGWSTIRAGKEESPPIPADEQPTVFVEEESEQPFTGGLLTSAQLRKALPKPQQAQEELTKEEEEAAQETVYRDASGRKIDTKAARAEAARKKREREEKEAKKMEWGKGLVQKQEEDARKRQLEKNRSLPFARRADDKELNEELKAKERWNDPAAAFLTKSRSKGPRKPEYAGPLPPPNRFGIKPGYRWDGVDRGNGFEKKYFQRHNERKRNTAASYEWSVDDM